MKNEIIALSAASPTKFYAVQKIVLPENQAEKLDKLGVFCGITVKLEKVFGKKTFIFNADGAKIAVGKSVADKILVKETCFNEKID